MARLRRQLKLPRSYFKKRLPPPAFRLTNDTYTARLVANLGATGAPREKSISDIRKILLQDMATNIVNNLRAIQMNVVVDGWKEIRSFGQLTGEVAILVDGSPQRPIKNMKLGGNVVIMKPASTELIVEAAQLAFVFMVKHANSMPFKYERKKPDGMPKYGRSFSMYVSDKMEIDPQLVGREDIIDVEDWISISNSVPYAAKLERYFNPAGVFVQTYKLLRKKYGTQLAIRFDYVEGTTPMKQGGYTQNVPQPVIRIGQPGAFPSRAPNIAMYVRKNKKRGMRY